MAPTNRWLIAALAALSILGVTALADALVTSDEERLDEVAAAVTHGESGSRLDALLAYADVEREPAVIGGRRVHDERELERSLASELGVLDEGELEVVETTSRVLGESGRIALRVRAEGEIVDAELVLRRDGQGWLLSGARRL